MVGLNQPVYSQVQGLQHWDQPAGQLDGYREVATANGKRRRGTGWNNGVEMDGEQTWGICYAFCFFNPFFDKFKDMTGISMGFDGDFLEF